MMSRNVFHVVIVVVGFLESQNASVEYLDEELKVVIHYKYLSLSMTGSSPHQRQD
jgi:hypothetical protein